MKMYEPTQCCCGASLKTGTLVLGWISLVGYILNSISVLRFAVSGMTRQDLVEIFANVSKTENIHLDPEVCADVVVGSMATFGVICLFGLAMSTMLLVGVQKKIPSLMLPYLITHGISIACWSILAFAQFILMAVYVSFLGGFIISIILGLSLALYGYLYSVVLAHYKEVKQFNRNRGTESNIAYMEQRNEIPQYKI